MIFVASGTQDGRGLVEYLLKQNYKVMASVVTNYGKELLPKDENLIINDHKLDEEAMKMGVISTVKFVNDFLNK